MRILSNFRDYYDGIQAYGQDQQVVYNRRTTELGYDDYDILKHVKHQRSVLLDSRIFSFYEFAIIFCGKVYVGFTVEKREFVECYLKSKHLKIFNQFHDKRCLYNEKSIKPYEEFCKETNQQLSYYSGDRVGSWKGKSIDEINGREIDSSVHVKHKSPVIGLYPKLLGKEKNVHLEDTEIFLNPKLVDFQFAKIVDPFTAYQEIAMYVGGIIPKDGPEMVQISEVSKLKKHDMDKWSFRKPPSKKRK